MIWYLARATGMVALIAFTASTTMGALASRHRARPTERQLDRRFLVQVAHRSAAVLGLATLVAHAVLIVLDVYVDVSLTSTVVPFTAGYRPLALGLGTLAVYAFVVVAVSGAARGRLAASARATRTWRRVHLAAYAGWALALGHGILAGTDTGASWSTAIYAACGLAVAVAVGLRLRDRASRSPHLRPHPRQEPPMTVVLDSPATSVSSIGVPRLLAGVAGRGRVDHARHLLLHGAPVLRRRSWLVAATRDVNLLGRGGAAFPVAAKLEAVPSGRGVAVLLNGSEGEPASRKDRVLMTFAPHLVVDGALVVADALGASDVTVVVHDAAAHDSLVHAVAERTDATAVRVVRTDDGFVGGEIRAVVNGLASGRAVPGGRRVLPHVSGVDGQPTFASNVETFAQLALLSRMGVDEYARTGGTVEPGTSLLTVLGDASIRGVVEVPNGTPLSLLLPPSTAPVLIGGYHGTWRRDTDGLTVDRAALRAAGSPLGAGVIARPHPGTCVVDEVLRVARWLAGESAGQCGPCFFGLPAIADDLAALAAGAGPERAASAHRRLALVRGRGACAHPDGSAAFVGSALDALADELAVHQRHGRCGLPASTVLPTLEEGSR